MQWWIRTRSADPRGREIHQIEAPGGSIARQRRAHPFTGETDQGCGVGRFGQIQLPDVRAQIEGSVIAPARSAKPMPRLDHVLTESPVGDQLAAGELFDRFEREPLIEQQQRPDDHGILRRGHVPAGGVRSRQALGSR